MRCARYLASQAMWVFGDRVIGAVAAEIRKGGTIRQSESERLILFQILPAGHAVTDSGRDKPRHQSDKDHYTVQADQEWHQHAPVMEQGCGGVNRLPRCALRRNARLCVRTVWPALLRAGVLQGRRQSTVAIREGV